MFDTVRATVVNPDGSDGDRVNLTCAPNHALTGDQLALCASFANASGRYRDAEPARFVHPVGAVVVLHPRGDGENGPHPSDLDQTPVIVRIISVDLHPANPDFVWEYGVQDCETGEFDGVKPGAIKRQATRADLDWLASVMEDARCER